MKKILSFILLFAMICTLSSCGKYVSSYSALGLVRNQTSHSCEASFMSLKGSLVFKIEKTDGGEGDIAYSIEAKEGEISLYYDIFGVKEELCTVKAGESVSDRGGYIESGYSVYIIIEANEKARGSVLVELNAED